MLFFLLVLFFLHRERRPDIDVCVTVVVTWLASRIPEQDQAAKEGEDERIGHEHTGKQREKTVGELKGAY